MSVPDDEQIMDMLLEDPSMLDDRVDWSLGNDAFFNTLLSMEENSDSFNLMAAADDDDDDLLSSAATTPTYDNAESSSYSDSGSSSADNLSFIPKSELSMSEPINNTSTLMDFVYDSFVKEEIIDDENDEDENDDDTDVSDTYNVGKNQEDIISTVQRPQQLTTTPRTVVISPKHLNGSISISKNLSKPVFVPINLSNVKTIKVINQNGQAINADAFRRLQSINSGRKIFVRNDGTLVSKSVPVMKQNKVVTLVDKLVMDSASDESDSTYPSLCLTIEEKKLMEKEGIKLPSHYPLSKSQERDLKRIRRKIRNKISAQDSRKRKKEYVDGLEDRVKQCSDENNQLKKTVHSLQTENERLKAALKRLQSSIAKDNGTSNAKCMMVILLSLALFAAPNLRPKASDEKEAMPVEGQEPKFSGLSRNLLSVKSESPVTSGNMKDVLNVINGSSSVDDNVIMAELEELLDFNALKRNKDHDYSRTAAMDDYYVPESDNGWVKAAKRSAPSEWVDELLIPQVKSRRETEQVILVSSDEESY